MNPLEFDAQIEIDDVEFPASVEEDSLSFDASTETSIVHVADKNYIHNQDIPSNVWTISHPLKKFPSVTIVDSAGTCVIGSVQYVDVNTIICSFSGVFSGKAYLN